MKILVVIFISPLLKATQFPFFFFLLQTPARSFNVYLPANPSFIAIYRILFQMRYKLLPELPFIPQSRFINLERRPKIVNYA